jgi:hypothetical protein
VQTAVAEGWVPEANLVEGLLLDQPFHKSLPAPSPLSKNSEGSSAHEQIADDAVQRSNFEPVRFIHRRRIKLIQHGSGDGQGKP